MIRLHGYPASINVRKVLWLLDELGLTCELAERGTPAAPVTEAAYRALNPFGLVPCLEHEGLVLAESNTILRYLARRFERRDLLPSGAREAAAVDTWIDWQATDLNAAWRYAFMAQFREKPGFDEPHRIAASRQAFDRAMTIVESRLAYTGGHIAAPAFTLADVPIGLSVRRWLAFAPDSAAFPHVTRYYAALCRRAAFLAHGGPDSPP